MAALRSSSWGGGERGGWSGGGREGGSGGVEVEVGGVEMGWGGVGEATGDPTATQECAPDGMEP